MKETRFSYEGDRTKWYGQNDVDKMVRGVQYVHWVMHKCIMIKVGGNEIHVKCVKADGIV